MCKYAELLEWEALKFPLFSSTSITSFFLYQHRHTGYWAKMTDFHRLVWTKLYLKSQSPQSFQTEQWRIKFSKPNQKYSLMELNILRCTKWQRVVDAKMWNDFFLVKKKADQRVIIGQFEVVTHFCAHDSWPHGIFIMNCALWTMNCALFCALMNTS